MGDLVIWGRINSHNVKKVVWLAEEMGLPYVRHDVGGQFGMDAVYRAKNPNALIPTIDDDSLTLWESNAIVRYLAAQYGGERWWNRDAATRALGDRWMDWHFTYAEKQRPAFVNLVRKAQSERDLVAIEQAIAGCAALLPVMERHLANNDWLSGDEFGIGDIPMGCYIHTWFALPIERPPFPSIRRWYDRLLQRAPYREFVAIPLS